MNYKVPYTYPISAEAQTEMKMHLIGQVMDQIRLVYGDRAVNSDTFDHLDDMTIIQLQEKSKEYEQKVKDKVDPNFKEAKQLKKRIESCQESIKSFESVGDKNLAKMLRKQRNEMIECYKLLTGRAYYP